MHSKFFEHLNGNGEFVCLPVELYKRWERQINTAYGELSEQEKESDRKQVYPYIDAMKEYAEHIRLKTIDEAIGCAPKEIPSRPYSTESDDDIGYEMWQAQRHGYNICRNKFINNLKQLKK